MGHSRDGLSLLHSVWGLRWKSLSQGLDSSEGSFTSMSGSCCWLSQWGLSSCPHGPTMWSLCVRRFRLSHSKLAGFQSQPPERERESPVGTKLSFLTQLQKFCCSQLAEASHACPGSRGRKSNSASWQVAKFWQGMWDQKDCYNIFGKYRKPYTFSLWFLSCVCSLFYSLNIP